MEQIKSRYDGKCAKCGRDIKTGWNIYYDKENKKAYCTPCGKAMSSNQPENSLTEDEFNALPPEVQEKIRNAGLTIKPPALEDRVSSMELTLGELAGAVSTVIDLQGELSSAINAVREAVIDRWNDLEKVLKKEEKSKAKLIE